MSARLDRRLVDGVSAQERRTAGVAHVFDLELSMTIESIRPSVDRVTVTGVVSLRTRFSGSTVVETVTSRVSSYR